MERVLRMVKFWEPLDAHSPDEVLDSLVETALHRTDEDAPRTSLAS